MLHNLQLAHGERHCRHITTAPPANPYTPSCQQGNASSIAGAHPPSPCFGRPVLSPWENKDRTSGVSRFDVERLAIPDYHGKENGVGMLNAGYLQRCGYHMISSDDVVTCYNEIILGHWKIWDGWHNPVTNTWGPQVDCILLKSFKLFPFLESMATEDVVNFYDRFYELSTRHLFAIVPFNAIV
jgi:hypothetical protein